MIKIGLILVIICAAVLAFAIIIAPAHKVPSSRFEIVFSANTADNVTVMIRMFGSYHTNVWNHSGEFLDPFKDIVRAGFEGVDHADIPKKVKLMFQKDIRDLKSAGVKLDSIYQYEPEAQ